jgi:predicted nucleic acid-binding Zn ribbon protein
MKGDPVPISESLSAVVRSLRNEPAGSEPQLHLAKQIGGVFGKWTEAVGEAVAEHVKPLKLDGTKLIVEVDDPAWATQLRFLESTLKERLRAVTGAQIETLEARVRRF